MLSESATKKRKCDLLNSKSELEKQERQHKEKKKEKKKRKNHLPKLQCYLNLTKYGSIKYYFG